MIPGEILAVLVVVIPGVVNITYRLGIKKATIVGASADLVVAGLMYFLRPQTGFFYIQDSTMLFIIMVLSVYLLSAIYSTRYLKGIEVMGIREPTYYLLLNLFTASMLFSLEVNNYGLMWVGIEATTISSALLLITEKSETSLEATWRYIIIVSAGVTFAFISIILIYYTLGTLSVSTAIGSHVHSRIMVLAVSLALIGFGTKVGVFPVHTWLPDAHSEAPSPVSAMFSGVLLPTALYVLYRVYEIEPVRGLYVWFAVVSIVAASIFMGYQARYKRMFAYSTMENMNLALLGIAVGGSLGFTGALLLLLSHSFGKAGAFYSSGNILRFTGKKEIAEINGMHTSMPYTSTSLLMSSLAVTGAPPFGTFFGEFLILSGVLSLHMYVQFIIVIVFLAAAFISMNYNVTGMIFNGNCPNIEKDRLMPALSIFSSVIPLFIGIFFLVVYNEIL
ncbi:formate hydrogenlyase subunit 4 [Thermoplasma volcanium GSS1]|uniref:Formate hydrogenlyase subunit 4 n=1 Tax=Thermoplasma volcanium (strain ATCC 51530 / DSM 4299 / JCM 9571 / NBRC 15438 / GSS1) TaxID=273116 RepID=Q978D7_THEVO|nr:hydrogenase 4 subunit F [Thermoplasma volcanium]BAB60622.1 formate hydrogenlyase subunit 4 [Thermoplasma volcanium GSS1]